MLSLIYSVFNLSDEDIAVHLDQWRSYSDETRKQIEIVLVDDCSKEKFEPMIDFPLNYVIARVTTDIYWNLGGARNLGFHIATGEYAFTGDHDHLFDSEEELKKVLAWPKKQKTMYFLNRERPQYTGHPLLEHKPHPNSFVAHREDFISAGGYDEDLSGHRGHTDHMTWLAMQYAGWCRDTIPALLLERSELTVDDPDHFKNIQASRARNRSVMERKQAEMRRGTYQNFPNLRFEWEIVKRGSYE